MKKRFLTVSTLLALFAAMAVYQNKGIAQTPVSGSADSGGEYRAMLDTYCVGCHNSRLKIGGLALDVLDINNAPENADVWEKALRKLRGNLMPPPGSPQPSAKQIAGFSTWMETELDSHATGPKAGHVPIQRLNRTEYAAAVKDLVGVEVDEAEVLPQDVAIEGFDNIAAALTTSPAFLDQFITSARHVARQAMGSTAIQNARYSPNVYSNPDKPLPPGTRGGIRFEHNFPADGKYEISILNLGAGLYTAPMEDRTTLFITVDGKQVFRHAIGGDEDLAIAEREGPAGKDKLMAPFTKIPIEVKAGVRDVVVAFVDRSHVLSDENIAGGRNEGGHVARLGDVTVVGPYQPTGISMTDSRAKIFVCDPSESSEDVCALEIAKNLATRAFRRPATDDDLKMLMDFYAKGRANGGSFDQGVEQVTAAVLASPDFLYRSIHTEPTPGGTPLNDLELASRLSFFLWSTVPDQELMTLAEQGKLSDPAVLEQQVDRMLADPKAKAVVDSFAMKWLTLDTLDQVVPDPDLFRGFSPQMRHDIEREAELFLSSILLEDRSVVDLLTSDRTYLNERLAEHYGINGVVGEQFREVELTDPARFGILGKAAVLMRTSYANRTSPVLRGAFVLRKLKGTPPTPPPPGVETNLDQKEGEAPKTLRARLEVHREAATCRQCHGVIDPNGLAMENFDAIGRWRTVDSKQPIDASAVLPNGKEVDGIVEMREDLASKPEMFARTVTEMLMTYGLNRELEYYDMPQIRALVREAASDNYTLSSLVKGIVKTDAFRLQGAAEPARQVETAQAR